MEEHRDNAMAESWAAAHHMMHVYNGSASQLICIGVYTGNYLNSSGQEAQNRDLARTYGAPIHQFFSLPVVVDNKTKVVKVVEGESNAAFRF